MNDAARGRNVPSVCRERLVGLAGRRVCDQDNGHRPTLLDGVLYVAKIFDLDPDHVAGPQELRGVKPHPHPAGGAGHDQVPRPERARLGDELDQLLTAEDQVAGARILAQVAVDPGPEAEVARVGYLVGRRDPGPDRAERVGALGPRPLGFAALEVTGRDVIGDAVARDPAAGPHYDRQLALVVQPAHDLGADDRAAGRSHRAPHLDEHDRELGALSAGLLDVLGVVEADRVHGSGIRNRRQQRHVIERPVPGVEARLGPGEHVGHRELGGERPNPVADDLAGADGPVRSLDRDQPQLLAAVGSSVWLGARTWVTGRPRPLALLTTSSFSQRETPRGSVEMMISWNSPRLIASSIAINGSGSPMLPVTSWPAASDSLGSASASTFLATSSPASCGSTTLCMPWGWRGTTRWNLAGPCWARSRIA